MREGLTLRSLNISYWVNDLEGVFMLVLAKSLKGREFYYNVRSAHQVSKVSAKKIADILNDKLNVVENWVWSLHDVDCLQEAYAFGETQSFKIRKGVVYEKRN